MEHWTGRANMTGIEAPPANPPAGWYTDPAGGGGLRWWDGNAWTGHLNAPWGMPTGAEPEKTSGYAIASLLLGLVGTGPIAIVVGLVALRRIRRSDPRLAGRGMAIAGIVLGVLAALVAALIVALAIGGVFDEDTNAERFTGEKRQIAFAIDRNEQLLDDEDFEEVCTDLYTAALADAIAMEADQSCPAALADEYAGGFLVDTNIERITIDGLTATATGTEANDRSVYYLVKQNGRWRIDGTE